MTTWVPATEAEIAMREALRASDQERYFRILSHGELLLPSVPGSPVGSDGAPAATGWGTWTTGGRTHVLAFTSDEAVRCCLGEAAGAVRRLSYQQLADSWPDVEWWLAVNPGLPVEGYLPAWFVAQVARGDVRLPADVAISDGAPVPGTRRPAGASLSPVQTGAISAGTADNASPRNAPVVSPAPDPAVSEARGTLPRRTPLPPREPAARPAEPVDRPVARTAAAPLSRRQALLNSEKARLVQAARGPAPSTSAHVSPASTSPAPTSSASAAAPAASTNDIEATLANAVAEGSTDAFLSALVLASLLVPVGDGDPLLDRPWRIELIDGVPHVLAFTSPELCEAHIGADPDGASARRVTFLRLIQTWPDPGLAFAVNPGTPMGATLPGAQMIALSQWASRRGPDDRPRQAPGHAPAAPPPGERLQKLIRPDQVPFYLERGYDRVAGFVHRVADVSHLRAPADLVTELGPGQPGSALATDEAHVLRWRAHRPELYRGDGPADGGPESIAGLRVDSVRLPHGAEMWRIARDGGERRIAQFDADRGAWRRAREV
ncbi:SseB family protein [Pilimelia columellifera]|uniref:SseB protein N-terminal domain-containing protein n=1 Tax=Pilimelia columellifera subsp. columellifera TaxID=706583 RepID=A0ABP6A8K6_9ACTN